MPSWTRSSKLLKMKSIDDKLLKIVALARQGIGGEKTAAIRLVKRICEKQGLDFDDVMRATDYREYDLHIATRNNLEVEIMAQVMFKFALSDEHPGLQYNRRAKIFFYTCTPSMHIETSNAASVYLAAYRKEVKKYALQVQEAFVAKHQLYRPTSGDEKPEPLTLEQMLKVARLREIANDMADVKLRKNLGAGQ